VLPECRSAGVPALSTPPHQKNLSEQTMKIKENMLQEFFFLLGVFRRGGRWESPSAKKSIENQSEFGRYSIFIEFYKND